MAMNTRPRFGVSERDNIELVRQIVFKRLREDQAWNSFGSEWGDQRGREFVEFEQNELRDRFNALSEQILWQLVVQGATVPLTTHDSVANHFRLTDYGRQVIQQGAFIPNDPLDYLKELKRTAPTIMTDTATAYVAEALNCYNASCHAAAVLLLGVAAESVFLELVISVANALQDPNEKAKLGSRRTLKEKHRWMVSKYQALSQSVKKQLPESLDTTLVSLYDLIRAQRNDLGHPQPNPPKVDRKDAFAFFHLLPVYVRDAQALSTYCSQNVI